MTLSKYTDNLYQSEVYRELERQAVKKGFFKPTDLELIKLAAQEVQQIQSINQEVDASPSDDLIVDVARLAYAMRRKGLVTQAEDLEQKLVIFKQAENAFYNVTKETNKDFMNFAHRDGDVNIIEGSGDLGTFETLQSVADKILAVTRKEPTGKQPMDRLAAFASMINKVAQQGGASGDWDSQGGQAASEAAPQQATATPREVPKTRREIITSVENTLNRFDVIRKQIQTMPGLNEFGFSDIEASGQLSAYVYFARLAGKQVNPADIGLWSKAKEVAAKEGVFQENIINAQMIFTKLTNQASNNVDILLNIANALGIRDNFASIFYNQNSKSYIFTTSLAGINVGTDISFNKDNIWKACVWLQQSYQTLINRIFGANSETFNAAQNLMIGIIEKLINELNSINISEPATATNAAVRLLIKTSNGINNALAKFTNGDSFRYLRLVNPAVIDPIVTSINSIEKDISEQYKSLSGSEGVKLVDIDASILDNSLAYWENQTSSEDDETANKAGAVSDKIQQLQEIIKQYKTKPWVEFQEALSEMKPPIDAPNKNVFLAGLQKIVDSSKGRK